MRQQMHKNADTGPLLAQEGEGLVRLLRGPHKGKLLSAITRRDLTTLLKRSYPHATDAELLLNEHLSRQYGRTMTAKTALSAMTAEWEKTKAKLDAAKLDAASQQPSFQQPSLSDRLFATLTERIGALANEADTWPLPPPDVG